MACQDWSRRGKRTYTDGPSMISHLAALRMIWELEPEICLHECTEDYDTNILHQVCSLFFTHARMW